MQHHLAALALLQRPAGKPAAAFLGIGEIVPDALDGAGQRVTCTDFFDPRSLLRIGMEQFAEKGADPSSLQPLYLRKSEAEIASGL